MSAIDGRRVHYRDMNGWSGTVIGDSYSPGFVRVHWEEPSNQIGIHRQVDLVVDDVPPSQEDLAALV